MKGFSRCIIIQLCDLKVGKDATCWGGSLIDMHFEKKVCFFFSKLGAEEEISFQA